MKLTFAGSFLLPHRTDRHWQCGVSVYQDDPEALVVLSEHLDHRRPSLTTRIEEIATRVHRDLLGGIAPSRITWIEHVPACTTAAAGFWMVTFRYHAVLRRLEEPAWERISEGRLKKLIGTRRLPFGQRPNARKSPRT